MAEHRHDLVRTAARLRKTSARCLAQPVRLTFKRQPSGSDCVAEPLAEAIDREWPTVFGIDNGHMVAVADGQDTEEVSVERNRELPSGLLLNNSNASFAHVGPSHTVYIAPALASIKHERECEPLLSANWPTAFKQRNLGVGPGSDFLSFRSLDAERRIVGKPSDTDGMTDKDPQNL